MINQSYKFFLYWIILLFVISVLSCNSVETEKKYESAKIAPPPGWVMDYGEVLTSDEEKELSQVLKEIKKQTGVSLIFYSITSLEGKPIEEVGAELASEMQVGRAIINDGGMILLAVEDRQIRVEVGSGLEWQIPDSASTQIVNLMIPYLKDQQYLNGLKSGFAKMESLASAAKWKKVYDSLDKMEKDSTNAIDGLVKFQGKRVNTNFPVAYLEKQFDSSYFIPVLANSGDTLRLNYTHYMNQYVDIILADESSKTIVGRIVELQPLTINLMGIE